jgi:hypothetical protein
MEDEDWQPIATAPLNTRIEMKLDKAVGPGVIIKRMGSKPVVDWPPFGGVPTKWRPIKK